MRFSILIPTLIDRRASFLGLVEKLARQVKDNELQGVVEILDFPNDYEHTLGFKHNELVRRARGEFVAFADDDDDVSDEYVRSICLACCFHWLWSWQRWLTLA